MPSYTTWNPSDKGANVVLISGNLGMYSSPGSGAVRSIFSVSTSKFYWEVTLVNNTVDGTLGVGRSSASITDSWIGVDANGWGYGVTGQKHNNGTGYDYGTSYIVDDIIGIALDMTNGEVYFSKNGVWQNSSDPVARTNPAFTGLTGSIFAMTGSYVSWQWLANFGASAFSYSVPSGYTPGLGQFDIEVSQAEGITFNDAQEDIAINIISEDITFADNTDEVAISVLSEGITFDDTQTTPSSIYNVAESEDITFDDAHISQATYNLSSSEDITLNDAQSITKEIHPEMLENITFDDDLTVQWTALCEFAEAITFNDRALSQMGTEVRRLRLFWNHRTQHLAIKFRNATANQRLYLEQIGSLLFGELPVSENHYLFNYRAQHISLKFINATVDENLYLKDIGLLLFGEKPISQNKYLFNLKGKHISLKFKNDAIGEGLYLKDIGLELYEHKYV